jgi:hypothetical protein
MNEPPSRAFELFKKYSGPDAAQLLQALPSNPEKTFEEEWLDFKSGTPKEENIKKIWSKAIGAFANNEGGVIIWGIDARDDKVTGIDAVLAVVPVPDLDRLRDTLNKSFTLATDPPLLGVQFEKVQLKDSANEGFLICYIPAGTQKAYRSEHHERRFYIRVGNESKEMGVSLLRTLFYPRRKLDFSFTLKATPFDFSPKALVAILHLRGGYSADDVSFDVTSSNHRVCVGYNTGIVPKTYAGLDIAMQVPITSIANPGFIKRFDFLLYPEAYTREFDVTFTLYARDTPPLAGSMNFKLEDYGHERELGLSPIDSW